MKKIIIAITLIAFAFPVSAQEAPVTISGTQTPDNTPVVESPEFTPTPTPTISSSSRSGGTRRIQHNEAVRVELMKQYIALLEQFIILLQK